MKKIKTNTTIDETSTIDIKFWSIKITIRKRELDMKIKNL